MNIKVEHWNGYDIRFVEKNGEWLISVDDVCNAFNIFGTQNRYVYAVMDLIGSDSIIKIKINNKWLYFMDELSIYKLAFTSRTVETEQFKNWSAQILQKIRYKMDFKPYEAFKMFDKDNQDHILHELDGIFFDEQTGKIMKTVTVDGGDVDIVEF